jgi:hypothetical protein
VIVENMPDLFGVWFPHALVAWLTAAGLLLAAALAGSYLIAALRHGPLAAFGIVGRVLGGAAGDLVRMSPRRVWALAWLAVRESVRRRVLVVFVFFLVVMLFAGWFLDPNNTHPARLYLSFVLTFTTFLVLLLALFLSVFSLPADLRSRTLHTVVTKPVRASEIVLGRMLGFAIITSALLAAMAAISYVFVVRGLSHTHVLTAEALKPVMAVGKDGPAAAPPTTELAMGHRHRVRVDADGIPHVELERGHTHDVTQRESDGKTIYELGPPEGLFIAKVPILGKLRFCDPAGVDTAAGINVGHEWSYRSYIRGGTLASAIWTFDNVREETFGDELPVEMMITIFRTLKGNIEKGVLGSLSLRNPKTGLTVGVKIFESKEYVANQIVVPRKIVEFSRPRFVQRRIETTPGIVQLDPPNEAPKPSLESPKDGFDLYRDLTDDGRVEVWLNCLEHGQYLGAAPMDLYLRGQDASFRLNFFKGYLGIWMQSLLIIGFGVMFSTFLSGPVALMASLATMVGGYFVDFVSQLAHHQVYGGGPFEAMYRLWTQDNLVTELEPGLRTELIHMADTVAEKFLTAVSSILPPINRFSYGWLVGDGVNIPFNPLVAIPFTWSLAYLLPVFIAGYFFLKTREVAR